MLNEFSYSPHIKNNDVNECAKITAKVAFYWKLTVSLSYQ